MKEVLEVELKNQPMGPPTVWLMYVVAGAGAGAAEEAAMVVRRRRRVMAVRFAIALRLDLMRCVLSSMVWVWIWVL